MQFFNILIFCLYLITIIENYDKGMKILIKISKYPNSTLYSDLEEKGKGKRIKKLKKRFNDDTDDIIEENKFDKKQSNVVLPPIPKLSVTNKEKELLNLNKRADTSHLPFNSVSLYCARKKAKLHLSEYYEKPLTVGQFDNAKKDDNIECSSINCEKGLCKIKSKALHKCAYASDGTVSLESIADAICFLSSMLIFYLFYLFAFSSMNETKIYCN